jgi:hypothetical protein
VLRSANSLVNTRNPARLRYLIHDRDAKYPELIDVILDSIGITTVLTGVWMPRMNRAHRALGQDIAHGAPGSQPDLE